MTKFATFLLSPLGVLFLLLLLALWAVGVDRRRLAVWVLVGAMGWVYGWSCPVVASGVTRWWEAKYPAPAVEEVPVVEVIVTLGGAMEGTVPPRRNPDLGEASDRLWHAARLYRWGKAHRILVSGGGRGRVSEAEVSVSFLVDLGVPREAIFLEGRSLNTIGNARESAVELGKMGVSRILLVTSATHMPRAMRAFRHVGLDPVPVPIDFQGVAAEGGWLRWLPSPDAFRQSSVTVKEWVGSAWYWVRYRPARGSGDP